MNLRRLSVYPDPPKYASLLPRYPVLSSRRCPLSFKTAPADIDWVLPAERRALAHELRVGDSVGVYGAEIDHPITFAVAGVVVRYDGDFVTMSLGASPDMEFTVAKRCIYGRAFSDALPAPLQPGFWFTATDTEEQVRRSALLYSLTIFHLRSIVYADPSFAAPGDDDSSMVVAQERTRRSARMIRKFVSGSSCMRLDVSRFDNYRLAKSFFKASDLPPIPIGSLVGDFVLLTSVSAQAIAVHLLLPNSYSQNAYSGYVYAELASLVLQTVAQHLRDGLPMWMAMADGCRVRGYPAGGRPPLEDGDDSASVLPPSLLSSIESSGAFSIGHVLLDRITNGRDLAIVTALIRKGGFAGAVADLMAHGAVGRIGGINCPGQPKILGKYMACNVRRRPRLRDILTTARAFAESIPAGWKRVRFYNMYCSRLATRYGFSHKIMVQQRLIVASKLTQQPGALASDFDWPEETALTDAEVPLLESLLQDANVGLEAHIRDFQDWWSSFSPSHCPPGLRVVKGESSFGDARGYFRAFNLLPTPAVADDGCPDPAAACDHGFPEDSGPNPWFARAPSHFPWSCDTVNHSMARPFQPRISTPPPVAADDFDDNDVDDDSVVECDV
jgi:hypothetical protein